jgi:hypothetical protein
MDLIMNGVGHGSIATRLLAHNMDIGALRPFQGDDGRSYASLSTGRFVNGQAERRTVALQNASASLRKDEWLRLDRTIMTAAKQRLRAVADVRARGLELRLSNGMGTTSLQYQTMGDITPATISMDPIRRSEIDRPEFDIVNMPLPIIHKDFFFTARQIAVSRNGGAPLDTTTAELAGRRVAEEAEKLLIGNSPSFSYGGGTVYGYRNHPDRHTHGITPPTETGWTPRVLITELLAIKQKLIDDLQFGPYRIYFGTAWATTLEDDYVNNNGTGTLRQRLTAIEGFGDVVLLDYLPGYEILVVQMTSDTVRMVVGFDITTLQWETDGGMGLHYKVMAMLVPQIRVDPAGQSGLVHAAPEFLEDEEEEG